MNTAPNCPKCQSTFVYADQLLWVCPECAHEWNQIQETQNSIEEKADNNIYDANGSVLEDGDSVVIIKSLNIKGASQTLKIGTKVKNIRLVESNNGHNIACKIDGIGAMNLKSEFVRKA